MLWSPVWECPSRPLSPRGGGPLIARNPWIKAPGGSPCTRGMVGLSPPVAPWSPEVSRKDCFLAGLSSHRLTHSFVHSWIFFFSSHTEENALKDRFLGTCRAVQWWAICLPMQEVQVRSPGLGVKSPHPSQPEKQSVKQKQYCNKFISDFKNGLLKKNKKKNWSLASRIVWLGSLHPSRWSLEILKSLQYFSVGLPWWHRWSIIGLQCGRPGFNPGRSPGEGKGYQIQYSCLENSMERGAWWATVHGVAVSWTRLSD